MKIRNERNKEIHKKREKGKDSNPRALINMHYMQKQTELSNNAKNKTTCVLKEVKCLITSDI